MMTKMFDKFEQGVAIVFLVLCIIIDALKVLAASILLGILTASPVGYTLHIIFGWSALPTISVVFYIVTGISFIGGLVVIIKKVKS